MIFSLQSIMAAALVLFQAGSQSQKVNPTFGAPDPARWNRVFANPDPIFNTAPNAFLSESIKRLKPGSALDVGMGQGRNSVHLAKVGWDVTGIDISDQGIAIAQQSAKAAGVKLTTINVSMDDFDFGSERWDLVVGTYVGTSWLANAVRGLKPGGVEVVEGFMAARDIRGSGVNEALKRFLGESLRILRYEDVEGQPDWSKEPGRVMRILAQKPL